MKPTWALVLESEAVPCLAPIRGLPGLELCEADGACWIRGGEDLVSAAAIRALPGRRFDVWEDGSVARPGSALPAGRLPEGPWQPLPNGMDVRVPARPAERAPFHPAALRLVRDGAEREPTLLWLAFDRWQAYAASAPALRLEPLRFAVSEHGQAVVHGRPLPPLTGRVFHVEDGIALPCGWRLDPPVPPSILARAIPLQAGDLALLTEEGLHVIRATDFVAATRSAVRLSPEPLPHA